MVVITKEKFIVKKILLFINLLLGTVVHAEAKAPPNPEVACERGDAKACHDYAIELGKNKMFRAYRMNMQLSCGGKYLPACEMLKKDDAEGEVYRRKCDDEKSVDDCETYATGMRLIYGDWEKSRKYFEKACEMGSHTACDFLIKIDL
jgi:TPR repeat protein